VLNGDGLVGRVTTVGPSTATVLLANDPDFSVGTRLEDSEELGLATGRGNNPLEVQLMNQQADVEVGDRMVTFGSAENRPFVPGVPVGEVISVERSSGDPTRTVRVRPYVSFTQLDLVGVVVEPPRDNPRDTVLPPRPADEEDADRQRDADAARREDEEADEDAGGAGEAGDEPADEGVGTADEPAGGGPPQQEEPVPPADDPADEPADGPADDPADQPAGEPGDQTTDDTAGPGDGGPDA
jgi:rod shape-determining protein MreC